ncbi:DotI/IcmL family type IV secretion protein [Legionella tunisiensis]|uniref:DotI/IcmL family type IV secretion protein n=1 Tax=Legionella tunisiensis TaxID=1034944 RepID=UPI0003087F0C|nr:DotI/IcmL family type IV secretion protein [Legionella tunisiensis]
MPIAQYQEEPTSNFVYKTLAEMTQMNQNFILYGLNQALIQSFDFKYKFLDTPAQQLHSWYAENGEVRTAAQKSDSIEVSKAKKPMISSLTNEEARLTAADSEQWKITFPLNFADANDKNKVTQLNVTIGWKIIGDHGMPRNTSLSVPSVHPIILASSSNMDSTTVRANSATPKIPANNPIQQSSQVLKNDLTYQTTATQQPAVINCDYNISTGTTSLDQAFVLSWAEYAAMQSFRFNSESIDTQLQQLQSCFTEEGWIEFKTAMYKSGNIEAIKTLQLTMSSEINGHAQLLESNNNQWKITLPLKVLYQSDKGKVGQIININLTVGRKITGDLGIRRMVATLDDTAAPPDSPHS